MILNKLPLIITLMLLMALPAVVRNTENGIIVPWLDFVICLGQSACLAIIAAFVCSVVRKQFMAWIFVIFCALCFYIDLWTNFVLFSRPSGMMVAMILQSNPKESGEFLQLYFISWPTLLILLPTVALTLLYPFLRRKWGAKLASITRRWWRALIAFLIFGGSVTLVVLQYVIWYDGHPYAKTAPQMVIEACCLDFEYQARQLRKLKATHANLVVDSCEFSSPVIALVIGESHSAPHSQFYGYKLVTMPRMQEEFDNGNLLVFKHVETSHIATSAVIKDMYSTHTNIRDAEDWGNHPLFFALFKKAGYDVRMFDNQSTQYDMPHTWDFTANYFLSSDEIHRSCFNYRSSRLFDQDCDFLDEYLGEISGADHELDIFHIYGQHMKANERYRGSGPFYIKDYDFRKGLTESMRQTIAHYDNATVEVDRNLAKIIDQYRDRDAVVIYVSDHGEEVHDYRNFYGRTAGEPPLRSKKYLQHVPMLVWMSDSYKENHPEMVAKLKVARETLWNNSYMAQFLLALAGIHSPYNQPEYSLIDLEGPNPVETVMK